MRSSVVSLVLSAAIGAAACTRAAAAHGSRPSATLTDAQAVRAANHAQNEVIASGDIAHLAEFWTNDVEIRRGLGRLIVGRDAYRQLFADSGSSVARPRADMIR